MRRRLMIGVSVALLAFVIVTMTQDGRMKGELIGNGTGDIEMRMKRFADTNTDGRLTSREMITALMNIIRGVALQNPDYDVDLNNLINRQDRIRAVQAFRALLAADCGNGVAEAGEECDDSNTESADGCSDVCVNENAAVVGTCEFDDVDHTILSVERLTQAECEAKKSVWCASQIDATVLYSEPGWGGAIPLYCDGPSRSCNIVTSNGGYVTDSATHPDRCIVLQQNTKKMCDFHSGSPIVFNGKAIHICKATSQMCTDLDEHDDIAFPGYDILTRYNREFTTPFDTKNVDRCFSGFSAVTECSGPSCTLEQQSCLGEYDATQPRRFSFLNQATKVGCFSGCYQGYCKVPLGDYGTNEFMQQFTCTDPQLTGGNDLTSKLLYVKNFLFANPSQAATDCILYMTARHAAKKIFLDELIRRGVNRGLLDDIAVHRLLQTRWGYNLPSTTNEVWNRDEAEAFLKQSNTPHTQRALEVYHTFGGTP